MIKYGLILFFLAMVILAGMTRGNFFSGSPRDPVPPEQKVAHSSHCAGCHGFDESGLALVDKEGNDVNIYDDWQVSMMGLSAYDPFWRATLAHEVSVYPDAKPAIESTCLKCHAPLGSFQAGLHGQAYSFEMMLTDSLGLDGVSCSACHQQPSFRLGQGHSGNFILDTNRVMFGPYPNPFQGPMQLYVGFTPVFSDHIYTSGVCAGCHTLITPTLRDDGTPSGDYFVEQATYHEWLNSIYPSQGKECQSCHLPFIADSVVIATDFIALQKRHPFGLHQFYGANTAMLDMMRQHKKQLGLPSGPSDEAWDESIANNRLSLQNAAVVQVSSVRVQDDTLYFTVTVQNKTGHKLPSGYPSRLAWLQILLQDPMTQETIYANGTLDENGNIRGRDHPFEPHHQISTSAEDVQIYEMIMSNLHGLPTTRLNAAYRPAKDNRLLPVGFKKDHQVYDTVAIWGDVLSDLDYGTRSTLGQDQVEYRIPLEGRKGSVDLDVSLRYQSLPPRWMDDLLNHDSISTIASFKSMYQGYEHYVEIIDQSRIENIDLQTYSASFPPDWSGITLFPNPVSAATLHIRYTGENAHWENLTYEIWDVAGRKLQQGNLTNTIKLKSGIEPGVYYLIVTNLSRQVIIKPFTIL